MKFNFSSARHRIAAALGALLFVGAVPGVAWASSWSPAARLTTAGAPFAANAVGAFAQADGSFLLSGYSNFYSLPQGAGSASGVAGGVFPAPVAPMLSNIAWLPDGTSLVLFFGGGTAQQRAANGAFMGSPQTLSGTASALAIDASGNATAVGVTSNNGFSLNLHTRPFGGSSFTKVVTPIDTSGAGVQMTLVGLVVDPSGAAVVTWLRGPTTMYQATRAAGASSFGAPAVLASNALNGVAPNGVSFASNATGRAVVVYYDGGGYSAAIRNPGGAFGAPTDITGTLTPTVANSASAVAEDGTAATLVAGTTADPTCGTYYSEHGYQLSATGSTWASSGVVGGTSGNSVSRAALAGGPGSRIDAVWSVDKRTSAQLCGATDSYEIDAGTLGGPMSPILSVTPPPLSSGSYGNGYTGGFTPMIALNSCGDGALIVGIADNQPNANSDAHDGLFTSTTTACAAGGGRPVNSTPPIVSGTPNVGEKLSASTGAWSGTAPISYTYQWQRCTPVCFSIAGAAATSSSYTLQSADQAAKVSVLVTATNTAGSSQSSSALTPAIGPKTAAIEALLRKVLKPSGKLAKISAISKNGGYALSFKSLGAGKLTISWYLVPKGARLAAAKPVLVASGKASFKKAGRVELKVKLTGKGKHLLKQAKRTKLSAKGAYTPTGGTATSRITSFTIKH